MLPGKARLRTTSIEVTSIFIFKVTLYFFFYNTRWTIESHSKENDEDYINEENDMKDRVECTCKYLEMNV